MPDREEKIAGEFPASVYSLHGFREPGGAAAPSPQRSNMDPPVFETPQPVRPMVQEDQSAVEIKPAPPQFSPMVTPKYTVLQRAADRPIGYSEPFSEPEGLL